MLAWVSANGGFAIVDERAATPAARRDGIDVHGTLWINANGVKENKLDRHAAERMVDQLVESHIKLPVDGVGFFTWAHIEGDLP